MSENSNLGKVVRFTNIAPFDFSHAYAGQPFFVKAGETLLFPYDLAEHLATHLARTIILRANDGKPSLPGDELKPLWNDEGIMELKTKILGDAYVEERPAVLTEAEKTVAKVAELNENKEEGDADVDLPTYKDKAEVIAAMEKIGLPVNPRLSKASLEKQLAEAAANMAPTI